MFFFIETEKMKLGLLSYLWGKMNSSQITEEHGSQFTDLIAYITSFLLSLHSVRSSYWLTEWITHDTPWRLRPLTFPTVMHVYLVVYTVAEACCQSLFHWPLPCSCQSHHHPPASDTPARWAGLCARSPGCCLELKDAETKGECLLKQDQWSVQQLFSQWNRLFH